MFYLTAVGWAVLIFRHSSDICGVKQVAFNNRSMSLSEQRKPSYNTVMSDSLLRTLDTLSLTSHDTFVQGR